MPMFQHRVEQPSEQLVWCRPNQRNQRQRLGEGFICTTSLSPYRDKAKGSPNGFRLAKSREQDGD
jgi:hypothetical protein